MLYLGLEAFEAVQVAFRVLPPARSTRSSLLDGVGNETWLGIDEVSISNPFK